MIRLVKDGKEISVSTLIGKVFRKYIDIKDESEIVDDPTRNLAAYAVAEVGLTERLPAVNGVVKISEDAFYQMVALVFLGMKLQAALQTNGIEVLEDPDAEDLDSSS